MATTNRKDKVPRVDWERHKDEILDLYLTQDLALKDLTENNERPVGCEAWNARKNLKTPEWKFALKEYTFIERDSVRGSLEMIKALIRYKADVNKIYRRADKDEAGGALNVLLRNRHHYSSGIASEIVDILLDAGAKVNISLFPNRWTMHRVQYDPVLSNLMSRLNVSPPSVSQ
ncbi:hypothetical protein F4677DRAFT_447974 [Hypoxylon crocopeplum]|nr:hypothetical protein F4677DRAFT_447974 [Hypoxylon crocopeplum]